jgi:hypothetical protein
MPCVLPRMAILEAWRARAGVASVALTLMSCVISYGSKDCPTDLPAEGDVCDPKLSTCLYATDVGTCNTLAFACQNGSWVSSLAPGCSRDREGAAVAVATVGAGVTVGVGAGAGGAPGIVSSATISVSASAVSVSEASVAAVGAGSSASGAGGALGGL